MKSRRSEVLADAGHESDSAEGGVARAIHLEKGEWCDIEKTPLYAC